ncbi:hypothetical protein BZA77DRAFT_358359 [Pyronema omphalodes]|nr:hypothetical protein BZA77DRAFT_358359 [Pyronema omphalodes]
MATLQLKSTPGSSATGTPDFSPAPPLSSAPTSPLTPLTPLTPPVPPMPPVPPLRFRVIFSTDPRVQRRKHIKGIRKRMAKLDGDIQLAKIRFGSMGDAQDEGISREDAHLLEFFCWMLTHPAEKSEKV